MHASTLLFYISPECNVNQSSKAKKTCRNKWYFEPKTRGSTYGSSDASEEFFKNDSWDNAIREIIQNSLDVPKSASKPINISIKLFKISTDDIQISKLRPHFEQALVVAKKQDYSKTAQRYLEDAIRVLSYKKMDVLAITDTGTTGLTGNAWKSLIHGEGITHKSGNVAGGSFGIGKNAPYPMSPIKTVFYHTKYNDSTGIVEKFIGRCKLMTHPDPKNKSKSLNPNGFFCAGPEDEDYAPIHDRNIPKNFRIGNKDGSTTIFIIGFNRQNKWQKQAEQSVANNFFKAIMDKKLLVHIDNKTIDDEKLERLLDTERLFNTDKTLTKTSHYHRLVKHPDYEEVIENSFGKFRLLFTINQDSDTNPPNHLAYINIKGMLITDAKQFGKNPFTPLGDYSGYAAILQAIDDNTEAKIRLLETPNHQSIEYKHAKYEPNFKDIEDGLRETRAMITEKISTMMEKLESQSQINFDELAPLLPMPGDGKNLSGKGRDKITNIKKIHPTFGFHGGEETIIGSDTPKEKSKGRGGNGKGYSSTSSGGRKFPSSFEKTNVKRHGNTLRLWIDMKNRVESITFHICPAGEQIQRESDVFPSKIRMVSPTNMVFSRKDSIITIKQPYGKIIMDVEMKRSGEYSGYMIREIREKNAKTSKESKN